MNDLLAAARASLDAALPATLSTVGADGMPNVTYISKVLYVDGQHVALTNQFFRKTRANLEHNPHATVMIVDPKDCQQFLLTLEFDSSLEAGPVFEQLRAELDAIATMMGLSDIFRLASAYLFRVHACERVPLEVAES
ncbi:MAG: pyridoxamine 5'-phosphate oxidase family protein [Myxococcales bacterium]|nr:pyridoxamine 5'-phosphate oxidase family protein [Myxococcales bacterium]